MTINYNLAVSTSKPWTLFKLLLSWKGSIWKAVSLRLLVWLILFFIISIVYRTAMTRDQQKTFENVVAYFDARLKYIPLDFMLGFFVTTVVNRFNTLYRLIGFIDNIGLMVALYVRGHNETARMYRRTIVRYCELSQVLVFRDISMRTRRRFPTIDSVVAAGFMMPHEKERFDEIQYRYSKYWLPFQWALGLTYHARKKGMIESDYYQTIVEEQIKVFRTDLAWLCNWDWVPIPIMYPQLVCLAVHTYFLVCLLARQFIITEDASNKTELDIYFPIMSVLQFIFYMGWMKVAEVMLNPFGEDDDDFETNALIDRNITMVMMMADQGYDRPPEMRKDVFWDDNEVQPLYSEETANIPNNPLKGSASEVRIADKHHEVRMVRHRGDSMKGPSLRKRLSSAPDRDDETRQSRRSAVSVDILKNVRHKLGRSISRDGAPDEPRKTLSSGHLADLEVNGKAVDNGSASMNEKWYNNHGFIEADETKAEEAENKTENKKSQANFMRMHGFPHHVLDDVMEENEDEGSRKVSYYDPGVLEMIRASIMKREAQRQAHEADAQRETRIDVETETDKEIENKDNEDEAPAGIRKSGFFIGHRDSEDL